VIIKNNLDVIMIIKKFREFVNEAGKSAIKAGKMELHKTNIKQAIAAFKKEDIDIESLIPNFEDNFKLLVDKFSDGSFERKDMPRLSNKDVKLLQKKLVYGDLDIKKPFSKDTNLKDKYPEHLKGKDAEEFLERGKKDGSEKDDVIQVEEKDIKIGKLNPLQSQVYFDHLIEFFVNYGSIAEIWKVVCGRPILSGSDNRIIDGHHRYAVGLLIDPNYVVPIIRVNLETKELYYSYA
jgi:hypothetical protein